jgi:hypothetical protein
VHPSLDFYLDNLSGDAWPVTCPAAVGGVPKSPMLAAGPVVEEHVRGGGREEVLRRRRSRKGRARCKREIMMLSMNCVIAEEFKRCQD